MPAIRAPCSTLVATLKGVRKDHFYGSSFGFQVRLRQKPLVLHFARSGDRNKANIQLPVG
jgi:hypothetical protein